jgi:ferric-dicitrate binding protein FerR (iron transport regulator)
MTDRSKFEAEDFLIDSTFQQYCAGTDQLSVTYWKKYISQHPEQNEVIRQAENLYRMLSGNKAKLDEAVLNYQQSFNHQKPTKKLSRVWWSVAASLLLIIGAAVYFSTNRQPVKNISYAYATQAGEKKEIILPDGSKVLLNAKSSIKLDKDFNLSNRNILLEGEAFFDVKHDKSKAFKVFTTDFHINVLGTAFNVKAYPDEATSEATLIRGLITMQTTGDMGIITLKPSQKVTFYKNRIIEKTQASAKRKINANRPEITINHYQLTKENTVLETAWTQNKLEIYDQDFAQLKPTLEKWYNVKIVFIDPEVQKYRFTATFSNESIAQVLEALKQVENFKYEIKENQISISK